MFIGLDLTSSQSKSSGYAILTQDGALLELGYLDSDVDVICTVKTHSPLVVAVDSPLGFPKGMCCLEESCDCTSVWNNKGRRGGECCQKWVFLFTTPLKDLLSKRWSIGPLNYRVN